MESSRQTHPLFPQSCLHESRPYRSGCRPSEAAYGTSAPNPTTHHPNPFLGNATESLSIANRKRKHHARRIRKWLALAPREHGMGKHMRGLARIRTSLPFSAGVTCARKAHRQKTGPCLPQRHEGLGGQLYSTHIVPRMHSGDILALLPTEFSTSRQRW